MSQERPRMQGVLETVLYYEDHDRTRRFYEDLLGMRLISEDSSRYLFFRAGTSVFLLFKAAESLIQTKVPPHGAEGPGHTCFLAPEEDYERWKSYLATHGVEMIQEVRWSRGLSFYFKDPAGNMLEIANADIWPTAPGQPPVGGAEPPTEEPA